ncbi:MAG: NADPH-dependent 7-cyano-7-deazaguanine reductase QueF [Bacteroidales bacterium]|jgi:7-cyano-7-deazaguanine reductase|nr:NADPH-dependent 7-cyano-7-deazaguanine reductase QueF [Bacteroidales bacterium]
MQPEATVLGKRVDYPQHYAPEMLVQVPRRLNRSIYDIDDAHLPFVGADAWHAYELSFLYPNGLPFSGLLKLVYPADSEFLVESKSLKLYLNSFNMDKYQSKDEVERIVAADLSKLVGAQVGVHIFADDDKNTYATGCDIDKYILLETLPEMRNLHIDKYTEAPELLETAGESGEMMVKTNLLRSNCKITHQPDWGTCYIRMKGAQLPTRTSLMSYLVSIRGENHFHEEICEMIYVRLQRLFAPEELFVGCIYTRRGGIDICPMRASSPTLLPAQLLNEKELTAKLLRQ